MNAKPIPPNKTKAHLEALVRNHKDVEVFEAKKLSTSDLREALKEDHVWVVAGKNKWNR